jgi:hypothetical protein
MSETKDFPTAAVLSLSTGTLFCNFSAMHEAAEYLMGHPIWTHHFASKDLWKKMQARVLEQCPGMPSDLPSATKDNYREKLAALETKIGPFVKLRKGDGSSAMAMMEGVPKNTPVIVIKA